MPGLGLVDDGQRMDIVALFPQIIASVLEALFHGDTDAHELSPGLFHDVDKPVYGVALGHKVVDDEDLILGLEPLLGHQQGHFFL